MSNHEYVFVRKHRLEVSGSGAPTESSSYSGRGEPICDFLDTSAELAV